MFAKRLKQLRTEQGLTQVEFARLFEISKGTIAMWETAQRSPDLDTTSKLADFFEVTTDFLLGKSDSKTASAPTEEDIKFALFDGDNGISDAAYQEVKQFAAFIKQKYKK